jgi:hypothetical protein
MNTTWDAPLLDLVNDGVLSGFALISHDRHTESAFGILQDEFWMEGGARRLSPAAAQFHDAFHTDAGPPAMITLCGRSAVVVRRDEGSLFAVARGKELGVIAYLIPAGVLVAAFQRPALPEVAVPLIDAAVAGLRRR